MKLTACLHDIPVLEFQRHLPGVIDCLVPRSYTPSQWFQSVRFVAVQDRKVKGAWNVHDIWNGGEPTFWHDEASAIRHMRTECGLDPLDT